MGYKDPAKQREYTRKWVAARRAEFMDGKCCVDCGSTERLELDHVDPATKEHHAIWSWSQKRRDAEIAKCVVRCRACHIERHAAERRQEHGQGAYKRGCRCDVCRAANAEKNRRWRESRRGRDLHPGGRLCRPLPSYSATAPWEQLDLTDLLEDAA